jgi:DNA-binding transcriptional ArsR family regulator
MTITKALSDENRVRTLMALRNGELCVCQIIDFLELAPSTVSRHMSILKQAGLVKGRKQGRWMYYRLPGPQASALARAALDWLEKSLAKSPAIRKDDKKILKIRREHDREEQCRISRKK